MARDVQKSERFFFRKESIVALDSIKPLKVWSPQRIAGIILIPSCPVRVGLVVISTVSSSRLGCVARIFFRVRPTRAQRGQR
ncbi:MAG: hypothetical protein KAI86_02015, partial [Desulfobacterales bacterium]|nr:hypothetical protein [Desulfobacterales bacterium]